MEKYENRLYELRGSASQKEFAEKLGMTQQNYANYENGKQGLKSDLIKKICRMFGCSAEWLLGFDAPRGKSPATGVAVLGTSAMVPVMSLGTVHAGDVTDEDTPPEVVEVPAGVVEGEDMDQLFVLHVRGDCMDRRYPDGSDVLVRRDMEPWDGCSVVAGFDAGESVLRVYKRGASTLMLSPDSFDGGYEDMVFTDPEQQVMLLGVVIWYQAGKREG